MKAVSLFSGVGGFELGMQRAGVETVLQAEIDPKCLEVLARHWPGVERATDVRAVGIQSVSHRYGGGQMGRGVQARHDPRCPDRQPAAEGAAVDLVYGGFPCQDLSVAGKRAGLSGERSGLWFEFHRILRELRPTWALIENVPGLLSSNGGRDLAVVLGGLEELGYGWAYRILDARYFGVPQRRRRVYIVGCLGDAAGAGAVLAVCEGCGGDTAPLGKPREGATRDTQASARFLARSLTTRKERLDGETETFIASGLRASDVHHGHSSPRGDGADNLVAFQSNAGNRLADECSADHFGPVRKGAGGSGAEPPAIASTAMGVRRLTPLECERLMGWPDDHTRYTEDGRELSDSHRYRMCGNGVVAPVAEYLGHRIVAVDAMMRAALDLAA